MAKSMEHSYKLHISKGLGKQAATSMLLLRTWQHRYKTRKQLHALLLNDSERLHNDLALNTEEVLAEIRKPFWR